MAIITVESQDHIREFDLTYSSDEPTIGGGSKKSSFDLRLGGDSVPNEILFGNPITNVKSTSVTSIGQRAFTNCVNLKSAVFSRATSIGASAFGDCDSLNIAKFAVVNSVDSGAFNIADGNGGDIFIGAAIEEIDDNSFACPGYTIHMTATNAPSFIGLIGVPFGDHPELVTLAVPEESLEAYTNKFGQYNVNIIVDTIDYSTFDWTTV